MNHVTDERNSILSSAAAAAAASRLFSFPLIPLHEQTFPLLPSSSQPCLIRCIQLEEMTWLQTFLSDSWLKTHAASLPVDWSSNSFLSFSFSFTPTSTHTFRPLDARLLMQFNLDHKWNFDWISPSHARSQDAYYKRCENNDENDGEMKKRTLPLPSSFEFFDSLALSYIFLLQFTI